MTKSRAARFVSELDEAGLDAPPVREGRGERVECGFADPQETTFPVKVLVLDWQAQELSDFLGGTDLRTWLGVTSGVGELCGFEVTA